MSRTSSIGSATEWQAEAERARTQPRPDAGDELLNARRAEILADYPLLLAAIEGLLPLPHRAGFDHGLGLIIDGLRARYAPESWLTDPGVVSAPAGPAGARARRPGRR